MKTTEKQIESQILEWLNLRPGIFAFKVNTTGIYDPTRKCFRTVKNPHIHKGTSDIIGCKNGRFFAIEVKTPAAYKKVIRKATESYLQQVEFIMAVQAHGGESIMVNCLDDVIEFIESMDWLQDKIK